MNRYLPLAEKLTDPEKDRVMPETGDSDANELLLGDLSPRIFSSDASSGLSEVAATACCHCCVPAGRHAAAPGTTPHPFIRPRDYSGFVIVRLARGIESGAARTLWDLARNHQPKLTGLQAVLKRPFWGTLPSRPLVELHAQGGAPLSCHESVELIRAMERKSAGTDFRPLHSLTSYWRLDVRQHPKRVKKLVKRLNSLPEVDLAYRELAANDPQEVPNGERLSEDQGHLSDAPVGIGAAWALDYLAKVPLREREPLTLCDLEQGWNLEHQDLLKQSLLIGKPLFGSNRKDSDKSSGDHGTAVLGLLAAVNSPLGVQGVAVGTGRFILASHYKDGSNGNVAAAILQALDQTDFPASASVKASEQAALKAGDILLIEVQRGLLPVEVDEADFDAIRLATGLGIIVIEAAGNGGRDLDAYSDPATGRSLRRGDKDSGAILVGAARASLPHDRAPFSNYGSRLDCFGWGEGVTTSGYGDLAGKGPKDSYTNSFSGTSSASPIVAGAAALLQSLHLAYTGERLKPKCIRELLSDPRTGTPQGSNVAGNIGPMPDLKAIVRDRLQLVPSIYLRRSMGDDGTPPAPGDEISSSPDIFISSLVPPDLTSMNEHFGEGGPEENVPAPGQPVKADQKNRLYIRLRNRGLREGKLRAQLFASPAATLITPERWLPLGECTMGEAIPQGDTLHVGGSVLWEPPLLPGTLPESPQAWSFLAVLTREEPMKLGQLWSTPALGLPPGPPYFDWAEYRAFLRGPGVAWRNTYYHPDPDPDPGADPRWHLIFFVGGTPDIAHHFDFEVIQRLPPGTRVSVEPPAALNAKFRQRIPWVGSGSGQGIDLPQRPRIMLRGAELPAGLYARASFTVKPKAEFPLQTGHSLALRQLWHGEEVGRITWFFGSRPATLR